MRSHRAARNAVAGPARRPLDVFSRAPVGAPGAPRGNPSAGVHSSAPYPSALRPATLPAHVAAPATRRLPYHPLRIAQAKLEGLRDTPSRGARIRFRTLHPSGKAAVKYDVQGDQGSAVFPADD